MVKWCRRLRVFTKCQAAKKASGVAESTIHVVSLVNSRVDPRWDEALSLGGNQCDARDGIFAVIHFPLYDLYKFDVIYPHNFEKYFPMRLPKHLTSFL
jgi:hypothetical protein